MRMSGLSVPYKLIASLYESVSKGVSILQSYASENTYLTIFSMLDLTKEGLASENSKSN